MGHAVENYEWEGLRMPGRVIDLTKAQASEEPMRNLYRRWAAVHGGRELGRADAVAA